MAVDEQLLQRARTNPAGLRFEEALSLAKQLGWFEKKGHGTGSHIHIFHHNLAPKIKNQFPRPLNLQNEKGMAKAYQVRQMIAMARAMGIIGAEEKQE